MTHSRAQEPEPVPTPAQISVTAQPEPLTPEEWCEAILSVESPWVG
jgi:hypothetical protein